MKKRTPKKSTAKLLGPVEEPGEAQGATSVTVPEELTAVRARRGQTAETRTKRGTDEAYSLFHADSMPGSRGVRNKEIGRKLEISGRTAELEVSNPWQGVL